MSSLSGVERAMLESLFEMKGGYVLDFSNPTFADFLLGSTGWRSLYPRYDDDAGSKANRLRAFWQTEADPVVGKLLADLIDYAVATGRRQVSDPAVTRGRAIAARLLLASPPPAGNTLNANDIQATNVVVGQQTIIHQYGDRREEPPPAEPFAAAQVQLLNLLTQHFDLDELAIVAFELDIDDDELSGATKTAKAISLIRYCQRRDLLAQLKSAMRRARPNIAGQIP